jgi:hypothetical protein
LSSIAGELSSIYHPPSRLPYRDEIMKSATADRFLTGLLGAPIAKSAAPALLHAGLWVADAVYTPLWTPLLTAARAKDARVMTGRELAIYASADAFELFTGQVPCTTEMGIAFDDVMATRHSAPDAA